MKPISRWIKVYLNFSDFRHNYTRLLLFKFTSVVLHKHWLVGIGYLIKNGWGPQSQKIAKKQYIRIRPGSFVISKAAAYASLSHHTCIVRHIIAAVMVNSVGTV